MDTTLTLQLTFINESKKSTSISISNVRPDVTEAEVEALMDAIISSNVFFSSGGDLTDKYGAQFVERNVTKFEVA